MAATYSQHRVLLLVLAILLLYLYALHVSYTSTRSAGGLAMASVSDFRPQDSFQYRVPYVLEERVVDPEELVQKLFRHAYVHKVVTTTIAAWTRARYTVLYSKSEGHVGLHHHKETTWVAMLPGRVLVVPPFYSLSVKKDHDIVLYELFDIASLIFSRFVKPGMDPQS